MKSYANALLNPLPEHDPLETSAPCRKYCRLAWLASSLKMVFYL